MGEMILSLEFDIWLDKRRIIAADFKHPVQRNPKSKGATTDLPCGNIVRFKDNFSNFFHISTIMILSLHKAGINKYFFILN